MNSASNPSILAIDTSSESCSVALSHQGESYQLLENQPRQHANLLLPMVQQVLSETGINLAQLDAIACCTGPGAFTGLRIAVAAAQGLAFSADLPCIAVSSLAALAQLSADQSEHKHFCCAIDARMNEVYFANYLLDVKGQITLLANTHEAVLPPESITPGWQQDYLALGNGWREYQDKMPGKFASIRAELAVEARAMLPLAVRKFELGQTVEAHQLQPVYLRNKVAEKSVKVVG